MKMKFFFLWLSSILMFGFLFPVPCRAQLLNRLKDRVEQTAEGYTPDDSTNTAIDKVEHPNIHQKNQNEEQQNQGSSSAQNNRSGGNSGEAATTLKSYQNYDFIPGDTILFADDFSDDQVGELPAHWTLCYGQGQVNDFDGKKVFMLTSGAEGDNATVLQPRMKKNYGYMPAAFTVEFDMYCAHSGDEDLGDPWVGLNFYGDPDDPDAKITDYDDWDLSPEALAFYSHKLYDGDGIDLPANVGGQNFVNKWHHIAIAYRDGQMKIYLDQNRIYVIPQVSKSPITKFGIRVSGKAFVTNIRIAAGGGMNMIGKKFTAAKIVTHGITFDIDKSDIKPQSMGTLNMIVNVLKANPDLRFEIDGHTDNTGNAAHNLILSQQRADAVKSQLIKMGISASRLSTKGFGDTKPIGDNATPDGRANNRRVEFVRI